MTNLISNVNIAAQYLRMSTNNQKYSIDNQKEYLCRYAKEHNIHVIYTYSDAGKSGLTIKNRPGLLSLISDIYTKIIEISIVLIYDVSRFGRFQDPEEAAHYSYILKSNGVRIIYCAEPFSEDQSAYSMLGLSLSRYGAADYSKNLSERVFLGQANLIRKGFRQGGKPGYGIRRQLIDEYRKVKEVLHFGQRKSLQTDRIILIPGPEEEIKVINDIYDMFISSGKPEFIIASELNKLNIKAENGKKWTRSKVHEILTNEKYIGNSIYNKNSYRLKNRHTNNPESEWIRCNNAWKAIISKEKFFLAKEIIANRSYRYSDDELLVKLKSLLKNKGELSGAIIDGEELFPSSSIYRSRFGGLIKAYELIGYQPIKDYSHFKIRNTINECNLKLIKIIIKNIYNSGGFVTKTDNDNRLIINEEINLYINSVRSHKLSSGKLQWKFNFPMKGFDDLIIFSRFNSCNSELIDYFIFPSIDILSNKINILENNSLIIDSYKFNNLSFFNKLIQRIKLEI